MKNITAIIAIASLLCSTFALSSELPVETDKSYQAVSTDESQVKAKAMLLLKKAYGYFPESKKVLVVVMVIAIMVMPAMSLFAIPFAEAKPLSYYKKSFEKNCQGKFTVRDSVGVPPEQLLKIQTLDLDQQRFGTCFAFSGYTLAQMHEWKHGGPDLALPHALAAGSGENFVVTGGVPREFLLELSQHKIASADTYPFEYNILYTNMPRLNPERRADTASAITASMKDSFQKSPQVEAYIDSVENGQVVTRPGKFQFDVLHGIPGLTLHELHPYQVRFRESENEDQVLVLVKNHFKKDQVNTPLSLGFCPEAEQTKCNGLHAVTVVGVRKACCNNECVPEWNIENSYGQKSNETGWHQAIPLARSSAQFKRGITDLIDCKAGEYCSFIEGKFPVHYLVLAGNAQRLADFLNKANLEFSKLLNAFDQDGDTPLTTAVIIANSATAEKKKGYAKLIQVLIKNGADPDATNKSGDQNPLSLALDDVSPDIAWALIENGACYFDSDQDKKDAASRLGLAALRLKAIPTLEVSRFTSKYAGCPHSDRFEACGDRNEARQRANLIIKERIARQRISNLGERYIFSIAKAATSIDEFKQKLAEHKVIQNLAACENHGNTWCTNINVGGHCLSEIFTSDIDATFRSCFTPDLSVALPELLSMALYVKNKPLAQSVVAELKKQKISLTEILNSEITMPNGENLRNLPHEVRELLGDHPAINALLINPLLTAAPEQTRFTDAFAKTIREFLQIHGDEDLLEVFAEADDLPSAELLE